MFKRKVNKILPQHIQSYVYTRNKQVKRILDKDKISLTNFLKTQGITYNLSLYQHFIRLKRTINFIYLVGDYFDNTKTAKFTAKGGPNKGFGVVRTQAYLFYKTGELLYEFDHDYQSYPRLGHSVQTSHKKLLQLSYDLHDKLNNDTLKDIGNHIQSFIKFDRSCLQLLKIDDTCNSIDFILEDQ